MCCSSLGVPFPIGKMNSEETVDICFVCRYAMGMTTVETLPAQMNRAFTSQKPSLVRESTTPPVDFKQAHCYIELITEES